ncbi:10201_t:CDS:2 [Ambispora gerdemannii]|uniref:10201_t:CDS:1 n=1 Tax=Ambispora gerdemannii TaxID=144530 RepID=A0A9N9AQ28_9GLOM|nr:10201_t:CDS:2 [Ambispora gerdemannii]
MVTEIIIDTAGVGVTDPAVPNDDNVGGAAVTKIDGMTFARVVLVPLISLLLSFTEQLESPLFSGAP